MATAPATPTGQLDEGRACPAGPRLLPRVPRPCLWPGLPGADCGGSDRCLVDCVLLMDNDEELLRGGRRQKLVPAASVFTGAEPSPAICLRLPCRREKS